MVFITYTLARELYPVPSLKPLAATICLACLMMLEQSTLMMSKAGLDNKNQMNFVGAKSARTPITFLAPA